MNFNPFKKEKYSKEGYEEAKKKADSAWRSYDKMGSMTDFSGGAEEKQNVYDKAIKNAEEKSKKAEKIFEAGKEEATDLNKEYNQRMKTIEKELADFYEFANKKLDITDKQKVVDLLIQKVKDTFKDDMYHSGW
ncbi:MAG TPA: hypothetical protein VIH31_00070 [Candidatus Paceibacterota bacterium]